MGAGTSPADGTRAGGAAEAAGTSVGAGAAAAVGDDEAARGDAAVPAGAAASDEAAGSDGEAGLEGAAESATGPGAPEGAPGSGESAEVPGSGEGGGSTRAPSRRFSLTRDTARPEGGGRAAPGDAPAPARQWPLLAVLCTAGAGLLLVGTDPFTEAFRIGTMLIGIALLAGAVLRWVVPSVGMLAVRSRFTDLVTYGLMGTLIVLLALMAQPKPWLDVPFLQDAVHFTIR